MERPGTGYQGRYIVSLRHAGIVALAAVISQCLCACRRGPAVTGDGFVRVPAGTNMVGSREAGAVHPPRPFATSGFLLGRTEVTVGAYARFLESTGAPGIAGPPQDIRRVGERFEPLPGKAGMPVRGVSIDDARRYCAWLSERSGRTVRLPTEDEWEYAARGGIDGARYPWGWGPPEEGRLACFAATEPARADQGAANPYGLYGMAGNVYEWCDPSLADGRSPARGGSWAEKDSAFIRVHRRVLFPPDYRGADAGFRVVAFDDAGATTAGADVGDEAARTVSTVAPAGAPAPRGSTIASCSSGTNSRSVAPYSRARPSRRPAIEM